MSDKDTGELINSEAASRLPLTQEMVVERNDMIMSKVTAQLKANRDEVYVIQWGMDVPEDRCGEPAKVTGEVLNYHPERNDATMGGFFTKVIYEDGYTVWIDMHLPIYAHGSKPPWFFERKIYKSVRNRLGEETKVLSHVERPIDKRHWLEFISKGKTRPARKVQG